MSIIDHIPEDRLIDEEFITKFKRIKNDYEFTVNEINSLCYLITLDDKEFKDCDTLIDIGIPKLSGRAYYIIRLLNEIQNFYKYQKEYRDMIPKINIIEDCEKSIDNAYGIILDLKKESSDEVKKKLNLLEKEISNLYSAIDLYRE